MKKIISLLLIIAIAVSIISCDSGKEPADTKGPEDTKSTTDTIDRSGVKYADTDSIVALCRKADSYKGVSYKTEKMIYSITSQTAFYQEHGSYQRDKDGNITAEMYDDGGDVVSFEGLYGDKYYSGVNVGDETDAFAINLSSDEKTKVSELLTNKYKDNFAYSLDNFKDITALDNEDGTYTLLCQTADKSLLDGIYDEVGDVIASAYDEYDGYSVDSLDYQLTCDSNGNVTSFVVMASVLVNVPDLEKAPSPSIEGVQSPLNLSAYVSYVLAAAVEEIDGTVASPDLSAASEKTYSEYFKAIPHNSNGAIAPSDFS